ncbi:hypothetical protein D3C80_1576070 [compost metagenome]
MIRDSRLIAKISIWFHRFELLNASSFRCNQQDQFCDPIAYPANYVYALPTRSVLFELLLSPDLFSVRSLLYLLRLIHYTVFPLLYQSQWFAIAFPFQYLQPLLYIFLFHTHCNDNSNDVHHFYCVKHFR